MDDIKHVVTFIPAVKSIHHDITCVISYSPRGPQYFQKRCARPLADRGPALLTYMHRNLCALRKAFEVFKRKRNRTIY